MIRELIAAIGSECVREQASSHVMKEWLQRMAEELVDDTIYEATMLGLLEAREEAERDDIVEEVGAK